MQKLEERDTYTPRGAPQAQGNCDTVIKHGLDVPDPVLRSLKTSSNNSDVDLLQYTGGPKANYVYVLNKNKKPLMPCKPAKARYMLDQGKAEVIKRKPFTIQLLWDCEHNIQEITLGIDSGYAHVGFSAVSAKRELISGEAQLRTDIPKKILEKSMYRRNRRNRLWYRPPRFDNRGREKGWLAPSLQHKLDTHIRLVEDLKSILPISKIVVEVASFDIQKIKNPDIQGIEYQQGEQEYFWNLREYVLHRDNHTCQHCHGKKKDCILEVHHINGRIKGGTDRPEELMTVCKTCHDQHHAGKDVIPRKLIKSFKPETFMTTIRWKIVNALDCGHMYGYKTKSGRIALGLPKTHFNDAFIIAGGENQPRSCVCIIKQVRRNNRSIQKNRKGYAPAIRRQRYNLQPNDLVMFDGKEHRIKGAHNKGSRVILDNKKSVAIKKVELITYGKGMCYV